MGFSAPHIPRKEQGCAAATLKAGSVGKAEQMLTLITAEQEAPALPSPPLIT